jgi:hypothetical protein
MRFSPRLSAASAFVAGVGEDRDLFQVGAGLGEDELAGGGDVVGAAGQRGGDPQRDAGGTGAVEDQVGKSLLSDFLQGVVQGGGQCPEDFDALVSVSSGGSKP